MSRPGECPILTEDELTVLVEHVTALEALAASQAAEIDFLRRERLLHREGAQALLQATAGPASAGDKRPRGNAGQLLLSSKELYRSVSGPRSGESADES